MATSGVTGANDMSAQLLQILMKGMQEQTDMSKKMMAMGVENQIAGQKMATAQSIIDAYA